MTRGFLLRATVAVLAIPVGAQEAPPVRPANMAFLDHVKNAKLLAAGDLAEALRLYRGPLLPRSEAPGVMQLREDLDRALRAAILASGQPEFLVSWTRSRWGASDLEMWQRLCAVLPASSPLRPFAATTAAKLDAELAC